MERTRIYLCLAHMSGNEQKYIQEAFDTNWVVPMGPNVNAFEADLERFANSKPGVKIIDGVESDDAQLGKAIRATGDDKLQYSAIPGLDKKVVALSAGTAAVHLALLACGVGPGDEVMVQTFTFCASSHPITYLGATPVFVDSEADTWNMDPKLLDEAISDRIAKTGKKPKAIVTVYLYGMPGRIDEYIAIGKKYGIPVIEDAAEALGSRFDGRVCGTMGDYGVMSFNGNKMITTSGGGALIVPDEAAKSNVMFYATQAREAYPYYQHEKIGYNYRMSNVVAGVGRGQMTVLQEHINHHKKVQKLYEQLLNDVPGIHMHSQPEGGRYDSNYWLCTFTIDENVKIKGQDKAYAKAIKGAVGGAAGVTHFGGDLHTDCEPNANVEALRMWMDEHQVECRPVWKPMHAQPCYKDAPRYLSGVSESVFHRGMCLPAGPWVTDDDVHYIVRCIKEAID
jgi:dTDP-4-amino-4,6-dideoxygalactose transaminase